MDKPIEAEYAVGDYLSEMYAVLHERGYSIDIDKIIWEKVKIAVNMGLVSRVFANLTDNVCKYANKDKLVIMETFLINIFLKSKSVMEYAMIRHCSKVQE